MVFCHLFPGKKWQRGRGRLLERCLLEQIQYFPFFANLAVKKTSLGFLFIQVRFTCHTLVFLWPVSVFVALCDLNVSLVTIYLLSSDNKMICTPSKDSDQRWQFGYQCFIGIGIYWGPKPCFFRQTGKPLIRHGRFSGWVSAGCTGLLVS